MHHARMDQCLGWRLLPPRHRDLRYANGSERLGDRYTGGATLYAPLSRRLEVQFDVPFADSYDGHTDFGDLQITPRIILSETKAVTESFNLSIRIPTGDKDQGNRSGVITPNYQFWANWWKGLVLRGGLGMAIPFHNQSDTGARTSITETLRQDIISPSMTQLPSVILSPISPQM